MQEEVTVDFSEEELGHLFVACGVQPPPGLEPEQLPPELRNAVGGAVERSLRARLMLDQDEGGNWQPLPTIAHIISLLARPYLAAKASLGPPGHGETRRYGILGPVGVEQRPLPPGVHRL
ncbi:MAG: hypothetical protein J2P57_22090, partial [Acidimicrobiaceae bacterium]|nr:hypothetical protein [Acidimicrobiaceae bacterium]